MPDPTDLPVPPLPEDAAPPETAAQPVDGAHTPGLHADPSGDTPDETSDEAHADPSADPSAQSPAQSPVETPAGHPAPPTLNPAACAELLRQHFPALFAGPAKPFKLRIQQDIQQRAPGVFSKATLSAFFRRHTGSTGYLMALGKATHRFDLDGQPAGELSDEHKQLAVAELARRRQLVREREQLAQAQQRAQQREAQRAEMAQQAEAHQARQARAALLRDFQRTTLTLANFCALKGMQPEALNPLLEQAKKEAAEAPPPAPRAFDDRRGPGPRRDERPEGRQDRRPDGRPGGRQDDRTDNRSGPRQDGRGGPGAPRAEGGPRPDNRGPRRDDRRPAGAGGAPGGRGPRGQGGPSGQGGQGGPAGQP